MVDEGTLAPRTAAGKKGHPILDGRGPQPNNNYGRAPKYVLGLLRRKQRKESRNRFDETGLKLGRKRPRRRFESASGTAWETSEAANGAVQQAEPPQRGGAKSKGLRSSNKAFGRDLTELAPGKARTTGLFRPAQNEMRRVIPDS